MRIRKTGPDRFETAEFGYAQDTATADLKGMKRVLRTVLKREFPRSNKIRVAELKTD